MGLFTAITWGMLGAYLLLILYYLTGWLMIRIFKMDRKYQNPKNTFTIIIPVRNEAQTIQSCLSHIIKQHYPKNLFEILVIDDFSDDHTTAQVKQFAPGTDIRIRLIQLDESGKGQFTKKAAISRGIEQAEFDWIILTDADCTRGPDWLASIDVFINQHHPDMIYAPVEFTAVNLFSRLQAIEFAGLVGIGAAAMAWKQPNMCSASNLIFSKSIFREVNGYVNNSGIASGDDTFLMYKFFKHNRNGIHFMKCKEAIVTTEANVSLKQFAQQRRRWVSKTKHYPDKSVIAVQSFIYFMNLFILIQLFIQPMQGIGMLCVKLLVEGVFMLLILHFFEKKRYFILLPLLEVIHVLYILIIGLWANIGRFTWKGREFSK
ncbi:MAG: glycosyltransferase [Bacteroidia bacterium]|jgi:glycosyltransferase involved in cell wall biosynthesis